MSAAMIPDEDLHAFLDGELPARRAAEVADAVATTPDLAARLAAFRADKRALADLYRTVAHDAIPQAWLTRIEQATAPTVSPIIPARAALRPAARRAPWVMALAASLAVLAVATVLRPHNGPPQDPILAEAAAARGDTLPPASRLPAPTLADATTALRQAVGLNLRAPDLSALHWQLAEMETYSHAATLRYTNASGQHLTLYLRPSAGTPRFDLLRDGKLRTCIWQDEVVGAVMMGEMTAGQMMRVASAAYLALNI
jgi:anti-sigma factor RsiW